MTELNANNPQGGDATGQELAENAQGDETVIENAEAGDGQAAEDDTEEVEHEGAKYKIPKALKPALLFQADYTRKTQEIANERKALAERAEASRKQAADQQAFLKEYAALQTANDRLEKWAAIDWVTERQRDKDAAETGWFQYQTELAARNKLAGELQQKMDERSRVAAGEAKRAAEESEATLRSSIKDWSPETRDKVAGFLASEFGVAKEEMATVNNPVMWKIAHRAWMGDQAIKKAAVAAKLASQEGVTPARQVGSKATSGALSPALPSSDKLSTEEWMRRERDRVRKKG